EREGKEQQGEHKTHRVYSFVGHTSINTLYEVAAPAAPSLAEEWPLEITRREVLRAAMATGIAFLADRGPLLQQANGLGDRLVHGSKAPFAHLGPEETFQVFRQVDGPRAPSCPSTLAQPSSLAKKARVPCPANPLASAQPAFSTPERSYPGQAVSKTLSIRRRSRLAKKEATAASAPGNWSRNGNRELAPLTSPADDGVSGWEGSGIADPWGDAVAELGEPGVGTGVGLSAGGLSAAATGGGGAGCARRAGRGAPAGSVADRERRS